MRGPRLAEILLQSGLAKEDDLRRARRAAEERGGSLLLHLVEGGVDETALVRALGRALRMATVSLRGKKVDPEVLRLVPAELAERYGCLPLFVKEEGGSRALYLGVEDPTDQAVADDVSFRVGLRILPVVVGPAELRRALRAALEQAAPPRPAPAPPLPEQPVAVRDTAPELGDAGLGAEDESSDEGKDEAGKPRDVPTREILRAVTRLLIEKEVFTRAELLAAVRAVRDGEGGAGDA
jgi:type IV pilus assembly protein PilB